jgi:hypothetical protein
MLRKLSIAMMFATASITIAMAASGTIKLPTCGWYFIGWAYAYGCW